MINQSPFLAAAALVVAGAIPAAAADGDKAPAEHPPTSAMDDATPTMQSPTQPEASKDANTSDQSDKAPAVHPPTKAMDQAVPQMKPDDKTGTEK